MDDFEMEERTKQLRELQNQQRFILYENTMLSEHLSRVVVSRKASLQLHLEKLEEEMEEKEEAEAQAQAQPTSRATVRFSKPTLPKPEVMMPMSMEEKCEIVEEEHTYLAQHIERIRNENERVLDDLRAVLAHSRQRIGEIRKERVDFTRDVMLLAQLNPANKPYSEDILRFIQEKLRRKRNVRDSLFQKNERLKAEIKVLEGQFATKKDLKDILHAVDFDQLKILNGQLYSKIRDRNTEVHRLKAITKATSQALNGVHKELVSAFEEGFKVKQHLTGRSPLINKTSEAIGVEKAIKSKCHEDVLRTLQDQDGPPQPRVTDYMRARDKAFNLRKELRTWFGKVGLQSLGLLLVSEVLQAWLQVEIAELTHKELKKTMKMLQEEMVMWSSSGVCYFYGSLLKTDLGRRIVDTLRCRSHRSPSTQLGR